MTIRIGRVTLTTPFAVPFDPVMDDRASIGGPHKARGFVVVGAEAQSTKQAIMDLLERESLRVGHVHVVDDDDLVPKGWYGIEAASYAKPRAGGRREWEVRLAAQRYPVVTREAEDDYVVGTKTTLVGTSEDAYVAYTPSTTDTPVLKLGSSLVLRYLFDEASGNVADSSGLGHTGVAGGTPTYSQAGRIGNGISFAAGGAFEAAFTPALAPVDGLTIEVFCKPDGASNGLQGMVLRNVTDGYELRVNDLDVSAEIAGSVVTAAGALTAAAWNHVVATYDLVTMRLYVDGALVASGANTTAMATASAPVIVGARSNTGASPFVGVLDEPRIYNKCLSAREVKLRYDATSGGTRPANDHRAPHDEPFDVGAGDYKASVRVQPTTTATARLRWKLHAGSSGAAVATGSQVTPGTADAWQEADLGTLTPTSAVYGANVAIVWVDDPSNTNPVWLDRVRVVRV